MGGRGASSMIRWAKSGLAAGGRNIDVTSKYQGMTLEQAEDAIRRVKGHEEAVIFDKNMNVIAAYSGGDTSVSLPASLKKRDDITITHNHPPGDAGYGATLSPADVQWFATSRAKEIRAVGSGQGEYVYSLGVRGKQSDIKTKTAKTQLNLWAHKVAKDARPVSEGGTGRLQKEYQRLYKEHRDNGASAEAARHAAWQQATGELERQLSDKVSSLGAAVVYYAKNKRYKVNR